MYKRFCPRCDVGTNSASVSKGTVSPPTPNPTQKRAETSQRYPLSGTSAVPTPKKARMPAETRNTGFCPMTPPNGPRTSTPHMAPMNTVDTMVAACVGVNLYSCSRATVGELSSNTSMAFTAKHKPAASGISNWNQTIPNISIASPMPIDRGSSVLSWPWAFSGAPSPSFRSQACRVSGAIAVPPVVVDDAWSFPATDPYPNMEAHVDDGITAAAPLPAKEKRRRCLFQMRCLVAVASAVPFRCRH